MCCLVQHTDTLCTISHDPGNDRAVKRIRRQRIKYCQERLNRDLIDQTASVLETESDETAYFKRSAAMKQLISENFLNLDEEYLDHFIDEMYGQIYPNE